MYSLRRLACVAVFEAGVFNLTQKQCLCLVHIGTTQINQMLLVRMEQPKDEPAAPKSP